MVQFGIKDRKALVRKGWSRALAWLVSASAGTRHMLGLVKDCRRR